MKKLLFAAASLVFATFLWAGVNDGLWIVKVPEKDRVRQNPFDQDPSAVAAGGKLFRQNCSQCNGSEALGMEKRPNMHSNRIRNATPGEVDRLRKNEAGKKGVPSGLKLPD